MNFGITDKKLKIIVNHIDSEFVNDSEKVKQALSEIERSIFYPSPELSTAIEESNPAVPEM